MAVEVGAGLEDDVAGAADDELDVVLRETGEKRMLADVAVETLDHVVSSTRGRGADGARLLGDVDADRAPGDAAAAADAAGGVELIPPAGELVRHPLAVARLRRGAHAAAVDVGEVHGEAGVPAPGAFGLAAGKVAGVLDRGAEAGRADHGAVAAGEAAAGDLVPARMLEVVHQQVADAVGVHRPPHVAAGVVDGGVGGLDVVPRGRSLRQRRQHLGAGFGDPASVR